MNGGNILFEHILKYDQCSKVMFFTKMINMILITVKKAWFSCINYIYINECYVLSFFQGKHWFIIKGAMLSLRLIVIIVLLTLTETTQGTFVEELNEICYEKERDEARKHMHVYQLTTWQLLVKDRVLHPDNHKKITEHIWIHPYHNPLLSYVRKWREDSHFFKTWTRLGKHKLSQLFAKYGLSLCFYKSLTDSML